jgi:hypothetical protein
VPQKVFIDGKIYFDRQKDIAERADRDKERKALIDKEKAAEKKPEEKKPEEKKPDAAVKPGETKKEEPKKEEPKKEEKKPDQPKPPVNVARATGRE